MADTFFDPDWTGTQSGTFTEPYVSWAGRSLGAGNRWLMKYGTTTTAVLNPTTGGASGNRATIGVYDHLTGNMMTDVKGGARIYTPGQTQSVYIGVTKTYITLTGFEICGANDYCIYKDSDAIDTEQHFWVENCILYDSLGSGADIRGRYNKVMNCDVHSNDNDGLFFVGNDAEVGWCRVWNNARAGSTGDGVQFYNSSNFDVHDSDIEHLAASKQALIANFDGGAPGTTGGTIVNTRMTCAQYVSGVTLADQKTLMLVNPGATVTGCEIIGGQYGAFLQGANGVLEDCLLVVSGSGAVVGVAIRASDVAVLRNTVIGRSDQGGAYGIDHSDSAYTGVTIHNNALKGWARGIRTTTSGFTYSHNAFENCTIRNSNSGGTEGTAGTGDVVGDFQLSPSFRPLPGSPLLNAGI